MTNPTGTEARVCQDIAARQQLGIAKYGVTVEGNPLTDRQWIEHAYQEGLDQVIYLRRLLDSWPVVPTEIEHLIKVLRGAADECEDSEYDKGMREGLVMAASNIEFVVRKLKEHPNVSGT